jgi:hypothetical protein
MVRRVQVAASTVEGARRQGMVSLPRYVDCSRGGGCSRWVSMAELGHAVGAW